MIVPNSSKGWQTSLPFLFRIAGVSLLWLTATGCQSHGDMSGKVLYQSKPVVFGTVLVEGGDGVIVQANIATDGSFTARNIGVGTAKVAVNSPSPRSIQLIPNKDPKKTQKPYPDVPGWFAIPKKYESVETSGLTYTIEGGSNTIDIELQ